MMVACASCFTAFANAEPLVTSGPKIPSEAQAGGATKVVYRQTQSTVDGVPFLVKGIYAVSPSDFPRVAGYGFNVVQTYGFAGMKDEEIANYMNEAHKHGLKVLFHLGAAVLKPEIIETVHRRVARFKDHPALYCWYLADEPSIKKTKPEELIALYQWIKKTDPNHPVFSSNWEMNNFKDACDVDMPQLYHGPPSGLRTGPLAGKIRATKPWIAIANTHDSGFSRNSYEVPGAESLSPAMFSRRDAAAKDMPEMSVDDIRKKTELIQGNLTNPPFKTLGSYPDTPIKIRGQAFDMFAHGSNGIFYWLLQPEDKLVENWGFYTIFVRPALRDALKDTFSELDELWPRIANPAENSTTWYEEEFGNVFCWYRQEGNQVTVIAVNESEANGNKVKVILPGLKNVAEVSARVSRENRLVKVKNGVLEDTFRSNQAHVYLIDLE